MRIDARDNSVLEVLQWVAGAASSEQAATLAEHGRDSLSIVLRPCNRSLRQRAGRPGGPTKTVDTECIHGADAKCVVIRRFVVQRFQPPAPPATVRSGQRACAAGECAGRVAT